MNYRIPSQIIVQKFCEDFTESISPIIRQASAIPLEQRWNVLFQCSIAPNPELIELRLQRSLLDLYQVTSLDQLTPRYIADDQDWGAIVSPRVSNSTGEPIAFMEHWFVTDASDLECMLDVVKVNWSFPFQAIWIPIAPQHRCALFVKEWDKACLQECAYVGDWRSFNPKVARFPNFNQFSLSINQALHVWWPDFCREVSRVSAAPMSKGKFARLHKEIGNCLQTGGVVNLYDAKGFAAHVSWSQGSEAELLIPQCWNIPYIFIREDLRGQRLAQHLYKLVLEQVAPKKIPLFCARVQGHNLPSWKVLESIGAERVLECYSISK